MEFVIRFFARAISRQLQQGSAVGAFVGALMGLLGGIGVAYLLQANEEGGSIVAPAIVFSILGVLIFSMLGSWLGPRTAAIEVIPGGSVKLMNLNRGLVPLLFVVLIGGVLWATVSYPPKKPDQKSFVQGLQVVLVVGLAVALWCQLRALLWIEVGPLIVIRRLIGTITYQHKEIKAAGFEVSRGRYVLEELPGDADFMIALEDGRTYFIRTPAYKTGAVAATLSGQVRTA